MLARINFNPVEIWDYFRKRRLIRRNMRAVLRLLYVECLKNLEVIKCVTRKPKPRPRDFLPLIDQLETGTLEFLFLEGEDSMRAFRVLSRQSKIVYEQGDVVIGHRLESDIRLIHVVLFVYLKISALKKFAAIERDPDSRGQGLRQIRYRVRLENIRANLDAIVQGLEEQKEFRNIKVRRFLGGGPSPNKED